MTNQSKGRRRREKIRGRKVRGGRNREGATPWEKRSIREIESPSCFRNRQKNPLMRSKRSHQQRLLVENLVSLERMCLKCLGDAKIEWPKSLRKFWGPSRRCKHNRYNNSRNSSSLKSWTREKKNSQGLSRPPFQAVLVNLRNLRTTTTQTRTTQTQLRAV